MPAQTPENSKTDLVLTIAVIIAIPVVLDVTEYMLPGAGRHVGPGKGKLGMKPKKTGRGRKARSRKPKSRPDGVQIRVV